MNREAWLIGVLLIVLVIATLLLCQGCSDPDIKLANKKEIDYEDDSNAVSYHACADGVGMCAGYGAE